ncbi:hypothetical protein ABGB14_08235 [Nonomuraea sp. B10E15]|uniref:hypothetical protein n=1 Tax=Nonomuraea sp. B10E15 TaxID=3153560 RepID=UPI00325D1E00
MSTPSTRVGCRAEIMGMLHSPTSTRAWASFLLGRHGTVEAELRNGTLAVLALDGDAHEMPGEVKRWAIHWDDLLIHNDEVRPITRFDGYRLGLSDQREVAVQHAVQANQKVSLCGETVRPLPTLGCCLPFLPTAAWACPACVRLVDPGAAEGIAPAMPLLPPR